MNQHHWCYSLFPRSSSNLFQRGDVTATRGDAGRNQSVLCTLLCNPACTAAIALIAVLGSTLVWPANAGAQQPTVVLLTLVDGTACRGPITGTTFNIVDLRANYACTDGRWILGEPFNLGDGRQVAMLGRTILQGQRISDDSESCQESMCVIGLEEAEILTSASLPRTIYISRNRGGPNTCTFQDADTFFLGTTRANYLCDPTYWRKLEGARQDIEYWIVGGPMMIGSDSAHPTAILATVVRQNSPLTNAPAPVCDKPFCVLYINQESLMP